MKSAHELSTAGPESFSGDLESRLELVRDRVGAEMVHLDQVAAVAESYAASLPGPLRLVR